MTAINTRSLFVVSEGQESFVSELSNDGRFIVFSTQGSATNTRSLFLRDLSTGEDQLIFSHAQPTPLDLLPATVSDDGRFVVFESKAATLTPGDVNGRSDIFVRDVLSGTTIRISETGSGSGGNGDSANPQITGDGRYLLFESAAFNFTANDSNGSRDIFVSDLLAGGRSLISRSTAGTIGNAASYDGDISSDGRYVAFTSDASNLVSSDANDASDIFLRDRDLQTTTLVSVAASGVPANGGSANAEVSDSGRFVVFESQASNLVAGDTNGFGDVFLRDLQTGTTSRLSASTGGAQSNLTSRNADISADGRYVVFESDASNLVSGDTNGATDIFLRDTLTNTTTRLSVGLGGSQANDDSYNARISADGTSVSFTSRATNLVAGDRNGLADIFHVSLFATPGADYLIGTDASEDLVGLGGSDVIAAGAGADSIDGGTGADLTIGGGGNDIYRIDTIGDVVDESAAGSNGVDTVTSAEASIDLSDVARCKGQVENGILLDLVVGFSGNPLNATGNGLANRLEGNIANNTLDGKAGADIMIGGRGDDLYIVDNSSDRAGEGSRSGTDTVRSSATFSLGNSEIEFLYLTGAAAINGSGNVFRNTIVGNDAANVINGGGGQDTFTGLGGDDSFEFSTPFVPGSFIRSQITDFVASDDTIRLSKSVFTAIVGTGQLSAGQFVANTTSVAGDADDRIIYNVNTGALLYDSDGTGAAAARNVAILTNLATISAADIFLY